MAQPCPDISKKAPPFCDKLTSTTMTPTRFVKQKDNSRTRYVKIKALPTNNDFFCAFYVRLFALFGDPSQVGYEGFHYSIFDLEQQCYIQASLTSTGAGYWVPENHPAALSIVEALHQQLFDPAVVLKECSLTYEHDFGTTSFGYKDGECVVSHVED